MPGYTAFHGRKRLASGASIDVALAVKALLTVHPGADVLIFDDETGRQVDFNLSGSDAEVAARLSGGEPAKASAKFSFRLVPNQDPKRLTGLIESHLERHCPPGIRWTLKPDHGAGAMLADANSRYAKAASIAIEQAFGTAPVMIREGGSIPILARFQEVLDCDCLLLGWGQNDDAAHSPNEKFSLEDFHRGIQASASLWQAIASA